MLRSTFFSAGLFIALWGISLLFIDQLVLNVEQEPQRESGFRGLFSAQAPNQQKVVNPPDWAAFSLMSIGSVTMLYSIALPKKKGGE